MVLIRRDVSLSGALKRATERMTYPRETLQLLEPFQSGEKVGGEWRNRLTIHLAARGSKILVSAAVEVLRPEPRGEFIAELLATPGLEGFVPRNGSNNRGTIFHEIYAASSGEDRPVIEATLKRRKRLKMFREKTLNDKEQ